MKHKPPTKAKRPSRAADASASSASFGGAPLATVPEIKTFKDFWAALDGFKSFAETHHGHRVSVRLVKETGSDFRLPARGSVSVVMDIRLHGEDVYPLTNVEQLTGWILSFLPGWVAYDIVKDKISTGTKNPRGKDRQIVSEWTGTTIVYYVHGAPDPNEELRKALFEQVRSTAERLSTSADLSNLHVLTARAAQMLQAADYPSTSAPAITSPFMETAGGMASSGAPWTYGNNALGMQNALSVVGGAGDVVGPAGPIPGALPTGGANRPETFASTMLREAVAAKKIAPRPSETLDELLSAAGRAKEMGLDDVHKAILERVRLRVGLAEGGAGAAANEASDGAEAAQ